MKRVTIQDIAKEMGLSRNTVAKALSNGNVSPETRQAVVQKACQMGYAKLDDALVEEVMHQKRKNGGGTILVLFNRWQSLFWNTTLAGISDGAKQEGYRMQLYIVNEDDLDGEEVLEQLEDDVQGIIFLCIFPIRFVKGIAKYTATVLLRKNPALAERTIIKGFDHTIEEDFFKKDILTVDVRIEALGRRLVKSVVDRIKNPDLDNTFVTLATYPLLA